MYDVWRLLPDKLIELKNLDGLIGPEPPGLLIRSKGIGLYLCPVQGAPG